MAKIIISGTTATVTSKFTTEQLKLLEKRNPEALVLKDEKENPIFAIFTGNKGSITKDGVVFGGTSFDGSGKAVASLDIPNTVTDVKAWVMEAIGNAIIKLNQLEDTLDGALSAVAAETAKVEGSIEVLG